MPSPVTSPMATASGCDPTDVTRYGPNCVPDAATPDGAIASSVSNTTDKIASAEIQAAAPAPSRRRRRIAIPTCSSPRGDPRLLYGLDGP